MLSNCYLHCSLPAFVIYSLVFQVHKGHSAPLNVTAPPGPITVAKGKNVVLPCDFSTEQNARDTEVIWFREQFSPFVHRYKGGQDQYGEQMPQYQGRTELLKEGLAKGSVHLKIFHVQPSDTGNYTCFVRRGSDYDEAVVELKVTASGSAPLIVLERYERGGIRVACRSTGWYPRPHVLWQNPQGQYLPSLSENAAQDENGLFAAESSIILTRGVSQELSCLVQHSPQRPEQGSGLYVSDPFFQDANPWMIALGVALVAVVALLALIVHLFKIKDKQAKELAWRRDAVPIEEVNVVLDPDTAHRVLVLSEDGKNVIRGDRLQDLPDTDQRFKICCCVLGRDGFTSGRHYWVVEVVDGGAWTVGVSREDVKKDTYIEFKPEEGIWAVGNWKGHLKAYTSSDQTLLPEIQTPKRIRVSLDYEGGRVAFFSVDEGITIFTFPLASFNKKKVHPWVWLGVGTCLKIWP